MGIVLFRRTRRTTDAVTPSTAAQQQNLIAGDGFFAPHMIGLDSPDHGADLQTLGDVTVVKDFAHVSRGQTDLVAIAGISGSGLFRNDALRQLPGQRIGHRLPDVTGTRDAHRLVNVTAARQRVADGPAQAGRSPTERLDFGRVVMSLVLELQQPTLGHSIDLHVDVNRAGIIFVADLQIIQFAGSPQVTRPDSRYIHQTDALVLATQLAADAQVKRQRFVDVLLDERFLDGDALQLGREGRMAAMVAPIGIENAQFGLVGVTPLGAEIPHHLTQVVSVHRQSVLFAERFQLTVRQLRESVEHRHGLHLGLLHVGQTVERLFARFDAVDAITADTGQLFVCHAVVENQELRRTDAHVGRRVDQSYAIDRRSGPLVELPGQKLDSEVLAPRQIARIRHRIGDHLAEDRITTLFEQLGRESEQIVNVQQPQLGKMQIQIAVQLASQALGLDTVLR